jgi:uncharacterized membrane protein YesL
MQVSEISSAFNKISIGIMRVVYLNILWILFSLVGLILFGVGPSFIALFIVLRKMIRKDNQTSIFSAYFSAFKSNFLKGNLFFYFYSLLACILYFDLRYFGQIDGILYDFVTSVFFIFSFLLFLAFCYIGPAFSHYKMSLFEYIKVSFIMPFIIPLESFFILLGLILCIILFTILPGLLPFLCISLPAFVITIVSLKGFNRWSKRMGLDKQIV